MFHKGDQLGSYTLIEKLGKGAFGEVWLAEEKTAISSHKFALKLPNEDDVDLEAIRQEADVWESVKGHPNILPIIKADIFEGQIYIASEYAPGGSLSQWLKDHDGEAPSKEIAVQMTKGILSGLEHLHSKGVIHRDLKPANILLQSDTPRIADFGIARLAKSDSTGGSTMSAGTPSYMAPECFYSVRSEQTDIWAVGVLLHKLLSGKLPFAHPDQVSVMNSILNEEPNIDSEIPESLHQIISKALQKDPASRYQSAAEMHQDLNSISLADLENDEPSSKKIIPPPVVVEKEEETIVRPKVEEIYIEPAAYSPSSKNKTIVIALGIFLVLAAATVWATLQFTGDNSENQPAFSNSTNQSSTNTKLTNVRSKTGTQTNFSTLPDSKVNVSNSSTTYIESPAIPEQNIPAESKPTEKSTPVTYDLKSSEEAPDANINSRSRQGEKPSINNEKSPAPSPSKTPPIPIEIAPVPSPTPRSRVPSPTPKATEKPEETPPLPKKSNSSESNMNF